MKWLCVPVLFALLVLAPVMSGKAAAAEQLINRNVFYAADGREAFGIAVAETYPEKGFPDYAAYTVKPVFSVKETAGGLTVTVKARAGFTGKDKTWNGGKFGALLQSVNATARGDETEYNISLAPGVKYEVTPVKRRYTFTGDGKLLLQTFVAVRVFGKNNPGKLVAIDPGHGGPEDLGTCGNNIYEKDANLDIALLTRAQLLQEKFGVYMTREDDRDLDLAPRSESANLLGADLFVSIHNNAFDPKAFDARAAKMYKGTTVLYNSMAVNPAKDLAVAMNDRLVDTLRTHEYPVQDRPGLSVLNSTWMPAVLAECTMFPNNGDAKMITDRVNRQKTALAIAGSVTDYLNGSRLRLFFGKGEAVQEGYAAGTAANHNLAVSDGEWIYYVEASGDTYGGSDSKIYRVRPDGSGQVKGETFIEPFCPDSASGLCLYGDSLYYENWDDGQKIYKIKTDGSCRKQVADVHARWLQRAGIWLVYAKSDAITGSKASNGLYKRSIITNEEFKLADGGVENVCVDAGYVYYQNWSDGYRIWRVPLAGGAAERVTTDAVDFFVCSRGKIYYVNNSDYNCIYVCGADGSLPQKLCKEKNAGYLLLLNEKIYYTRTDAAGLWRLDENGRSRLVTAIAGGPLNSAAGLIYYRSMFLAPEPDGK